MLDRTLIEGGPSKNIKRPLNSDEEKDVSASKLLTPRTRAEVRTITPNISTYATPRSSSRKRPITTTPKKSGECSGKKSKSNTPKLSEARVTRRKSITNTPDGTKTVVSRRSRSNTPVSARTVVNTRRSKSNTPVSTKPMATRRQSKSDTPVSAKTVATRRRSKSNTPVSAKIVATRRHIKSNTPVNSNTLATRRRSKSNTPVSSKTVVTRRRSKSNIPVSVKNQISESINDRKITPLSMEKQTNTRALVQHTPIRSEQNKLERNTSAKEQHLKNQSSPKCNQTPKIPHSSKSTKSQILDPVTSSHDSRGSANFDESNIQQKSSQNSISCDYTKKYDIRNDKCRDAKKIVCDVQDNDKNNPSTLDDEACERYGNISPESDVLEACSRTKRVNQSPTDSSGYECIDEIKKEVEKVKKRRSTVGQSRSKSTAERRSHGSVLPIISFEDQIANIDRDLPQTSKVGHLIDIALREAMRRLKDQCPMEDTFSDMRIDLLTNSESIGGHTAYKIAGLSLVEDEVPQKKERSSRSYDSDKIADLKMRTKKLEEEYKCWKQLLKERKRACQAAEREFREAKSGETKLDDECIKTLTSVQKERLSSKPNYSQYIEEIKMAYETTFFTMQEVNQTVNLVSNFTKVSKAVGDSLYSAVEEMTLAKSKRHPVKSSLSALLTMADVPTT